MSNVKGIKKISVVFVCFVFIFISMFSSVKIRTEASSDEIVTGIRQFQTYINNNLPMQYLERRLDVDGICGPLTQTAAVKLLQYRLNVDYSAGLEVDGHFGPASQASFRKYKVRIERYEVSDYVYILQGLLYCHNYNPKGFDGSYGAGGGTGCLNAVEKYKLDHSIDEYSMPGLGYVGPETMASLCWKPYGGFTKVNINEIRSAAIDFPGDVDVFTFTVPENGYYRFESNGAIDVRASINAFVSGVYTQLDYNDNYDYPENGYNFRIYEYLTKGTVIYIDVRGWENRTGSYTVRVTRASAYVFGYNYFVDGGFDINTTIDSYIQCDDLNYIGYRAVENNTYFGNIFGLRDPQTNRYAPDNELFIYNGHGDYGLIRLPHNTIITSDSMPNHCFFSNKISLWFNCKSALRDDVNGRDSMTIASLNKGSDSSFGFLWDVDNYMCYKYARAFVYSIALGRTMIESKRIAEDTIKYEHPPVDSNGNWDYYNPINIGSLYGDVNMVLPT